MSFPRRFTAESPKAAQFAENWNRSREIVRNCQETIDRARRLLEQLETIRADVRETLRQRPRRTFAWLSTADFDHLAPAQKEAYLHELADHLNQEMGERAHGIASSRSNLFLAQAQKS